jgi:hypothetical protein
MMKEKFIAYRLDVAFLFDFSYLISNSFPLFFVFRDAVVR